MFFSDADGKEPRSDGQLEPLPDGLTGLVKWPKRKAATSECGQSIRSELPRQYRHCAGPTPQSPDCQKRERGATVPDGQ